jgi:hypothetical protein
MSQETAVLLSSTINNGQAIDLRYGRSKISMVEVGETKSARKAASILTALKTLKLFNGDAEIGTKAIVHDFTGLTFVQADLGAYTPTRFIHARTIVQNGNGQYAWGNGEQLSQTRLNVGFDLDQLPFITSGPCLFSAEATKGISRSGKEFTLTDPYASHEINLDEPIVNLKIDERLQPYEAEAILRLTQSIASIHGGRANVCLDLPRVAYKLYLLDFFLKGIIGQDLFKQWLEIVDSRTTLLANLIQRRLPPTMSVNIIEPLAPINDLVHQLADGHSDKGGLLLQRMQNTLSENDPMWSNVLGQNPAQRFVDLGYLGYAVTHLMAARAAGPNSALVVIESPEETKIMDATFQALKGGCLNQPHAPIIGLYPHSDVIITNEESMSNGRNFLYHYRGELRDIMRHVIKSGKKNH